MRARTAAAAALGAAAVVSGCSSGSPGARTEATYGELPSFLPTDAVQADAELVGSATSPAVTSQGDSVKAQLGTGSVSIVVAGPQVPGQGLPNPPAGTTATWTVTLTNPTTTVPVAVSDFTAIDHLGKLYRPGLVPGAPEPPATLAAGATTTFELRAYMAIGEGIMRWAPGGRSTLATWDFVVEND